MPCGFVVTTAALRYFLDANELSATDPAEDVRHAILSAPMPIALDRELRKQYSPALRGEPVAVQ